MGSSSTAWWDVIGNLVVNANGAGPAAGTDHMALQDFRPETLALYFGSTEHGGQGSANLLAFSPVFPVVYFQEGTRSHCWGQVRWPTILLLHLSRERFVAPLSIGLGRLWAVSPPMTQN